MRYRLRTLLIATSVAAVVCLGLRAPSFWWSGGIFGALVLALLTSVMVAIYRDGQTRAMAIGFFVFSAGFLGVEGALWTINRTILATPTNDLIRWSYEKLYRQTKPGAVAATDDPFGPDLVSNQFYAYKDICLALLAVVVGLLGATIAQFLERTRRIRAP
jgi:hypothetical protein